MDLEYSLFTGALAVFHDFHGINSSMEFTYDFNAKEFEELKQKYNSDNLFKYRQKEIFVENTNLPVEIKKESLLRRFVNFIKNLISKKEN